MPFDGQYLEDVDEMAFDEGTPCNHVIFHIIDHNENVVTPMECKNCGCMHFYAARGCLQTVIKCTKCDIEITVHEG